MKGEQNFWLGRRVFLTGHTGFKGSWLALWLAHLGATVRGFSLPPAGTPSLFEAAAVASVLDDLRGDIRDSLQLEPALQEFAPEVVFHLAAQPLVRHSYADPLATYDINVMGTARLLDAIRRTPSVRAVIVITTDKCYENREWVWGYRETDALGGYDPYSSSKACAEIVAAAFRTSYFPVARLAQHRVALATARAGNVIGGGDWSPDRLLPDLVRGLITGKPVPIRRPDAIRPWQHVVEPLHGYLLLAEKLCSAQAAKFATAYNFGPPEDSARSVSWIADSLGQKWAGRQTWFLDEEPGPHEAGFLKLDSSRARSDLGWTSQLPLETSLEWVAAWYQAHHAGQPMHEFTLNQIRKYESFFS